MPINSIRDTMNGHQSVNVPNFIFRKTSAPLLHKALSAYALRQRSISDNIANVNTPGFHRSEVQFEEDLKKVLRQRGVKGKRTHDRHFNIGVTNIAQLKGRVVLSKDPTLASGVNNVDIDKEMVEAAKTAIRFQAAAQRIHGSYSSLQSAIRGEAVR